MKKLLPILIILIAVGAGGAVFYAKRGDKEPTVTALAISRGSIVDGVRATGTLQAVTSVTVGAQVSGIVQDLNADFNDIVKKNQVIARLDPSILQTQLETAEANRVNAQANLERQKVALDDAKVKLARAEELDRKQLTTRVDLENAQVAVKQADAQLKSTQSQIVQADAAVNKAKVDLDHTIITAPIDGIIIKRSVDRGQTVNAGMQAPELFIIAADLTKMQVNANIDETDVGRMRPGQEVNFTVDAYPSDNFRGTVKQVRLNPTTVQNVVTYSTVIDVPNPELKLKPGMTANVVIQIARRDNVLRIPNAALRFRPTKDMFEAINQAVPPELERGFGGRGGRGGNGGGRFNAGSPSGGPTGASGAPGAAGATAGSGASGQQARASRQGSQGQGQGAAPGQGAGQGTRQQSAGQGQGGGQGQGAGPGGGQGGRGNFANMTPEEREKRRQEMMANMTPEQRAQFEERRKQREAQGGGAGTFGGGQGQGGNFQRGQGNFGGGQGGNFAGGRGGTSGGGNASRGSGSAPQNTSAPAAASGATTIDALFGPLPTVETRGRAWLYINKQLKPIELRLGITDGTYTEILNDSSELQPNTEVVTTFITPDQASKPNTGPQGNQGNPLMPQQRGRGPGGPGGRG
jgi:HlyD family secretion protein